jgi:site-specific DNA-cytosine methylase
MDGLDKAVLVEVFSGIGGGRCAFDLAALHVACLIALGTSRSATAVIESAWPEVHNFGDAEGSASRGADAFARTLAVRPTS